MSRVALLEAIDRAIAGETEARNFYAEAAEKTADAGGTAMFRELADFEDHHRTHLEALKSSLAAEGPWLDYPARSLSKAPASEGAGRPAVGDRTDALEALRLAIGAEERAAAEYEALAAAAPEGPGRAMFKRLAEEEKTHRKLLDEQFLALANRGVWFWND